MSDGEYMNAESICNDLLAKGMQEIDILHLDQYDLDFTYVD